MSEVAEVEGWSPVTIYEPIPVCRANVRLILDSVLSVFKDRCIPQELPALQDVLPVINILR